MGVRWALNWGNSALRLHASEALLLGDKDAPFLQGRGGHLSPEELVTCFRRRSESFLHLPFRKLLQLNHHLLLQS